jgi:hypothetical protein
MSFAMTQEWRSPLLRPRLVRSDIFIHELKPDTLDMLHQASEQGLTPSSFDFDGDILILRFQRDDSRKPSQEE